MIGHRAMQRVIANLATRLLLLSGLAVPMQPLESFAQQSSGPGSATLREAPIEPDGRHDFDFALGSWKTNISRRLHPLTGSDVWADYEGSSLVRPIWGGRASLGETEADGPAGHLEALSLRLYNPRSRQWALSYASTGGTTGTPSSLTAPTIGEFSHGRGEFYDTEAYNDRNILVRNTWSDITPNSIRFEQAFSEDGGRTWETNWIAVDTRIESSEPPAQSPMSSQRALAQAGSQHDFDFEFGAWKTHIRRLQQPLSDARSWSDYAGLSTVHKVWSGLANFGELEIDGQNTHIEGLSFRLYDAQSHQWSIYWANSNDGKLGTPMIGGFRNGRGEFYNQDYYQGTAVLVRFVFSDIKPTSFRFEQAFSGDGGKSWQPNWTADFLRE
jgi:hypothetical protein